MTPLPAARRGMYFEEYEVGQEIKSVGRTVTETDIVNYAGLSGDYNQIHVDAQYSADSPFGQRVAHGLLGLSIASGLAVQTGIMEGTILAFRGLDGWKFIKPIFAGDTIHVHLTVKEIKAMPRVGGGMVKLELNVRNQDELTVQKGIWSALIASAPSGSV